MTFQWMLVATFLYIEIIVILVLLLPFISPSIWKRLFNSRVCHFLTERANLYFSIFIAVLVLFFLDAIRDMRKYSSDQGHSFLDAEIHTHLKLFRSQRNFYISGFALFLWFVIRRLLTLLYYQATLIEENETIRREAQSSTVLSQKLLKEKEEIENSLLESAENLGNSKRESREKEIQDLRKELVDLTNELESTKQDLHASKHQIEIASTDYYDLMEENICMQNTLASAAGSEISKKEE